MSWFSHLFRKEVLPPAPKPPPPEETGAFIPDFCTFEGGEGKSVPQSGTVALLHFDFFHVFPAFWWGSTRNHDREYPQGFSYRILSARHEPSGHYECVFIRDLGDRGKVIMNRTTLPKEEFPAKIDALVKQWEPRFNVQFLRRDLSNARSPEEFKRLMTGGG